MNPTLPQLLIIILQTIPMPPELLQAVLINVLQHARGAAGHFPALAHAVEFAAAVGFGLAHHVVIVVGFAAGADEVGGAEEGGGGCTDFVDGRDGGGEGGCVEEDGLVEAGGLALLVWNSIGRDESNWEERSRYRGWRAAMVS